MLNPELRLRALVLTYCLSLMLLIGCSGGSDGFSGPSGTSPNAPSNPNVPVNPNTPANPNAPAPPPSPSGTPPSFVSTSMLTGEPGKLWRYDIILDQGASPTPALRMTKTHPWLLLTGTTLLGNAPNTNATYDIEIMADNGVAPNAFQTFTLTIAPPVIDPPRFTSSPPPGTIRIGEPWEYFPTVAGTPTPIIKGGASGPFALDSNPWRYFVSNWNSHSGQSIVPGQTIDFNIRAYNNVGPDAFQVFSLLVLPPYAEPTIYFTQSHRQVIAGYPNDKVINFKLDGEPVPALTWSPAKPSWIDTSNEWWLFTPSAADAGSYSFKVKASNGQGPDKEVMFDIEVVSGRDAALGGTPVPEYQAPSPSPVKDVILGEVVDNNLHTSYPYALALCEDKKVRIWSRFASTHPVFSMPINATHLQKVPTVETVPGLPDVEEIAGLNELAIARGTQGRVWAWGRNDGGTCGVDPQTTTEVFSPSQVPGLNNVIRIATFEGYSVSTNPVDLCYALTDGGDIYSWGNHVGANPHVPSYLSTLPSGIGAVEDFYVQSESFYVLTTSGELWARGENGEGQLGFGHTNAVPTLTKVNLSFTVTELETWHLGCFALDQSGNVWGWGKNISSGLLGDAVPSAQSNLLTPTKLPGLSNIISIDTNPGSQLSYLSETRVAVTLNASGGVHRWGEMNWMSPITQRTPQVMGTFPYAFKIVAGSAGTNTGPSFGYPPNPQDDIVLVR